MKKILFAFSLLILPLAFIACGSDDKKVSTSDLPPIAQAFLQAHFPSQKVTRVEKDNDSYDVYLANGFEVEFKLSGEWDSVDGKGQQIPADIIALLPSAIPSYIAQHYPTQYIVEINKEHFGYEINLNNNIELKFDSNGTFLRVDK